MNIIEKILRQVWVDGWERGVKQCKRPYDYTLGDDTFLLKKWNEIMKWHKTEVKNEH